MPARFRRIIHQRAQVSSFETFCSNPESLTIVLLSYPWYSQNLLENALAIRPCNWEAASEPVLPKVARCIPVLPSRYIGKCAARVLKRSGETRHDGIDQPYYLKSLVHVNVPLILKVS